jgi:hypothetical protein
MFGYECIAMLVGRVARKLPPESNAVIVAVTNLGMTSARHPGAAMQSQDILQACAGKNPVPSSNIAFTVALSGTWK